MRTTLDLDPDVLQAAKELASARNSTAGRIISELVRRGLQSSRPARVRNGVPLLKGRASESVRPTMMRVNELRDGDKPEEGT